MSFESFNLHPRIMSGVQALGYKTPTPIQLQSIPSVMLGHDVLGLAQTGTGKTAAFVLPILQRLMDGPRGRVRALIIAPTRELAQQIHETIEGLAQETNLRSMTLYGGVSINPQLQKLRRGIEIIVACPGRLLDHLNQRSVSLTNLEVLVLDEADHMFDMGFIPSIRRILQQVPAKRQTLLFSATMPDDIGKLARDILKDPLTVKVGEAAPANTVSQALYPVSDHLKTELLFKMLQTIDTKSVLIFTRTKHRAKRLAEQLEKAGYPAASLQGNLSQNKRQAALNDFRDGTLKILVATDIASRGIDVACISHVINFDTPNTVEAYTHRIGRTGRAMKIGDAFTLVTRADMGLVKGIERLLGTKLEQRTMADFNYQAAAPKGSAEPNEQRARRPQQQRPNEHRSRRPMAAPKHANSATKPTAATANKPKHYAKPIHNRSPNAQQRSSGANSGRSGNR